MQAFDLNQDVWMPRMQDGSLAPTKGRFGELRSGCDDWEMIITWADGSITSVRDPSIVHHTAEDCGCWLADQDDGSWLMGLLRGEAVI